MREGALPFGILAPVTADFCVQGGGIFVAHVRDWHRAAVTARDRQ